MKIKLIFTDWHDKDGFSVYQTRSSLTEGQFHHGTTFNGTIELDAENSAELTEAIRTGNTPIFELALD